MSLALIDRANRALNTIPSDIDFTKYLSREERARVVSAEAIAEEGKRQMLLGTEAQPGLLLPWEKCSGKVIIRPGKLAVWCGWSFHGKSQLLKHLMTHAISVSEKVCIASMEEELLAIWKTMARIACGVASPGAKSIDNWSAMSAKNLWFYDQQGSIKAEKIRAVIRYAAEELKVTQFVIDSLMMLSVSRDDYDAQSVFVGELKTLAADTGCTIHLVAHMRKGSGKGGEDAPGTPHDISGGHEVASKADYVFNVWRDKNGTSTTGYSTILKVEKQRGDIDHIGSFGLNFDKASGQYIESHPIRYCNERVDL